MARRYYNNLTGTGELSGAVGTSDTTVPTTGFTSTPTVPFTAVIDRGLAAEECVLVTANAGGSLTVQRGYDTTAASSHSAGATIEHAIIAEGPNRWDDHAEATSGMHGVTGSIVGTTQVQTVTDKTFQESVFEGQNTTSPGSGALHKATVDNTSRAGFTADTTGIAASGKGFNLVQSGADKWRINADGSVMIAPSGTPTWAQDITGNQRVTGAQTVTGTATVGAVSTSGAVSSATLSTSGDATVGGTLGVTGNTTLGGTLGVTGAVTASGLVTADDISVTDDLTVGDDTTIGGTVTAEGAKVVTATVSVSHARVDSTAPVAGGAAARSIRQPIVHHSIAGTGWSGFDGYSAVIHDYTWTQVETGNVNIHILVEGKNTSTTGTVAYGQEYDLMVRLRTSGGTLLYEGVGYRMHGVEFAGSYAPVTQQIIVATPDDILTAGSSYKVEVLADRLTGGAVGMTITALAYTVTEVALV